MIRFFLIVTLTLFFVGCSVEERVTAGEKPADLIDKVKMTNILVDLSIVESTYQIKYIHVIRYNSLLQKEADSIFHVNKVSREQFESSMGYYSVNQEELKDIYQKVRAEIEKRHKQLDQEN